MSLSTRRHRDTATQRVVARAAFFLFRGYLLLLSALIAPQFAITQDVSPLETAVRSGSTEQRRDALFQIRNLRSEIASRAALPALTDPDPVIRATAASSVIFLPHSEAIAVLTPLLTDKDAFVRKEAAYALGKVESLDAAPPLIALLVREKDLEVKAAVAVALGQTGNREAVKPLIAILKRAPNDEEEFLRRAAARSIGQIAQVIKTSETYVVTPENFLPDEYKKLAGDDLTSKYPVFSAALESLTAIVQNGREADDTRREAAFALGAIGSPDAVTALETHRNSTDPYLAEIAREALAKIARASPAN